MTNNSANYYGLIFSCPVGEEIETCCFSKIRKVPIKEKLTYYNRLDEREKKVMIGKHQHCLSVREKKLTLFHESQ